jgi:hypothetical protein
MARQSGWQYWLVLGALAASACASTQSLLIQRFSKEHSCQKDAVLVREAGSNVYVAEGCGQQSEYVCQSFAGKEGSEKSCVERGVNPNTPAQGPPRPVYTTVQEPPR